MKLKPTVPPAEWKHLSCSLAVILKFMITVYSAAARRRWVLRGVLQLSYFLFKVGSTWKWSSLSFSCISDPLISNLYFFLFFSFRIFCLLQVDYAQRCSDCVSAKHRTQNMRFGKSWHDKGRGREGAREGRRGKDEQMGGWENKCVIN